MRKQPSVERPREGFEGEKGAVVINTYGERVPGNGGSHGERIHPLKSTGHFWTTKNDGGGRAQMSRDLAGSKGRARPWRSLKDSIVLLFGRELFDLHWEARGKRALSDFPIYLMHVKML